MKKDKLSPLTVFLSKYLPDEPWRDGESTFDLFIPMAEETDKGRSTIPFMHITLNKQQYEYIKQEVD